MPRKERENRAPRSGVPSPGMRRVDEEAAGELGDLIPGEPEAAGPNTRAAQRRAGRQEDRNKKR